MKDLFAISVPPEVQPQPDRRRRPGVVGSSEDPSREVAKDQRGRASEHRLLPGLVAGLHRQVCPQMAGLIGLLQY